MKENLFASQLLMPCAQYTWFSPLNLVKLFLLLFLSQHPSIRFITFNKKVNFCKGLALEPLNLKSTSYSNAVQKTAISILAVIYTRGSEYEARTFSIALSKICFTTDTNVATRDLKVANMEFGSKEGVRY